MVGHQPNATKVVMFQINTWKLAVADIATGNTVSASGVYEISFDDGTGFAGGHVPALTLNLTGADTVLGRFPM